MRNSGKYTSLTNGGQLTSVCCFSCRFCCKFRPEDTYEVPLFTSDQKDQATKEHSDKELHFKQKGSLWQIELKKLRREKAL